MKPFIVAVSVLLILLCCPGALSTDCIDVPVINNGNFNFSGCSVSDSSVKCTAQCDAGYTGYPLPQAFCNTTTGEWQMVPDTATKCILACAGSPALKPDVVWTGNVTGGSCTDSVPAETENNYCAGTCQNGLFGTPRAYCTDLGSGPEFVYVGKCLAKTCLGTPTPRTGTIWPLDCWDSAPGDSCQGTCNTDAFYGTGHAAAMPAVSCIENATAPSGAAWNMTATNGGKCVPVCNLDRGMARPWITNGVWYNCQPDGLGYGGLEAGDVCYGNCSTGFIGSPKLDCPRGVWFINRRGNCLRANKGACLGPPPQTASISNVDPWDAKCWDVAANTTCTSTCKSINTTATPDPLWVWSTPSEANFPPYVPCLWNTSSPTLATWSPVAYGKCSQVCQRALPPPPQNGSWPSDCRPNATFDSATGRTSYSGGVNYTSGVCVGTCNTGYAGRPTVACTTTGWQSVVGVCLPITASGVCVGRPVTSSYPTNAAIWPCTEAVGGTNCTTTCSPGFASASPSVPAPTVQCVVNPSAPSGSGATWATTFTGQCNKVCTQPLPVIANVAWSSSCTPVAGVGGIRPGGLCIGTCINGRTGSYTVTCTNLGWTALTGGCT